MTTKAKFTNSRGQSITFDTLISAEYVLNAIPTGFGEVQAEKQTQKAPFQDGSTVTSITLSEREISMDILIRGTSKEDISRKRQALAAVIDPRLGAGELIVQHDESNIYRIVCIPDAYPTYPAGKGVRSSIVQAASIQLTAHDPDWTDLVERQTDLIAFSEAFEMPFEFPLSFGVQGASQVIYNSGNVETPFRAELKGPNEYPRIENLTTGEKIQLNRSLSATETLVVNTQKGQKSAYVIDGSGVITDVMGFLDIESTFFSLGVGANEISYNAQSGTGASVARIFWRQRYNAI